MGSQLDSLAGKAIREPEFRRLPYHSRITHSRHRTAIGGHRRTPSWSISYSRGRRGSLSDTGGHVPATVRDREAPGSNPGPPTKPTELKFPRSGSNLAPNSDGLTVFSRAQLISIAFPKAAPCSTSCSNPWRGRSSKAPDSWAQLGFDRGP